MLCPSCSQEMVRERHRGVETDVCASCPAIWFDGGELLAFHQGEGPTIANVPGRDAAFVRRGVPSLVHCPRCAKRQLESAAVGDRTIMICPSCRGLFAPLPNPAVKAAREEEILTAVVQLLDLILEGLSAFR